MKLTQTAILLCIASIHLSLGWISLNSLPGPHFRWSCSNISWGLCCPPSFTNYRILFFILWWLQFFLDDDKLYSANCIKGIETSEKTTAAAAAEEERKESLFASQSCSVSFCSSFSIHFIFRGYFWCLCLNFRCRCLDGLSMSGGLVEKM